MRRRHFMPVAAWAVAATVWVAVIAAPSAQQAPLAASAFTPVPRVMWFSGVFSPADRLPVAAVESVTVAVYRDRDGGDALWQETQQVGMAADGGYSLLLGSTLPEGLPVELFTSGEPRWIGITVHRPGEVEQPRVHLASVAYALKAADADTLGGLPASAYLRADPAVADGTTAASDRAPADSTTAASSGTAGYLGMFVDSANLGNSALVQSGGFVGLGTTVPRDGFHVAVNDGTGTFTGYAVQNLSGAAGAYSGMLFYDQTGVLGQFQGFNNATHEYRINNIASGGRINFMIGTSSKFLVANNGNIGVGANPPDHKLHVLDASNTGLRVQTGTAGGTVASFGGFGEFRVDAPGIVGGRLVVKEDGRVGIRTGSPAATLELQSGADHDGTSDPTTIAFAYRQGGFRHWIRTRHNAVVGNGNAIDFFVNNSGFGDGSTGPGAGSIHVMTLDSGNVGIGTTIPDRKLSVNGGANKVGGGSWEVFSDERLKNITGPFTPGLTAVMQLQPVRYEYKPDNALGIRSSGEHIGFSAQAVQAIVPEAVSTNDKGYLLVNNDPILWTMLNAIQEQQKEIQDLQRRLAALEATLAGRR